MEEKFEKSNEELTRHPRRRRWPRIVAWLLLLAVLCVAVATFPEGWGPSLASAVIGHYLPHGPGYVNEIAIKRITLSSIKVEKVRLRGLPTAPSIDSARIRYTLLGLLRKRLDSVTVSGLSFRPEYVVTNCTFASKAFAGEITVNPDPLQGWSVKLIEGNTAAIDFAPLLTPEARVLFPSVTCALRLRLELGTTGYSGRIDGDFWGGALAGRLAYAPDTRSGSVVATYTPHFAWENAVQPGDITAHIGFNVTSQGGYGVKAKGDVALADGSVKADVRADVAPAGVDLYANVTRRQITEKTPVMATVLSLAKVPPSITDIAFSAAANANFRLTVTNSLPEWTFEAKLRDGAASMKSGEIPLSLGGASATVRLKGIGPHFDVLPMHVSFTNVVIGTISLDGGRANLIADQESLLISEGSVAFCGGFVRLYALYLNFERLSTGFTVVLDGLEVEKFLLMFPELKGTTATGKLYGRLPLHIFQNGSEIRLRDSFLYTPPGDVGKVCVGDAARVEALLSNMGLPTDVARNLSKALRNLDYDVIRLDLHQPPGGGDGKLTIRLRGESRDKKAVTPVDVNISVNGALEKVLNFALKTAKMKGK